MLTESSEQARRVASRRRQPPNHPVSVVASYEAGCHPSGENGPAPTDLTIEATNDDGEVAEWFDDTWWTGVVRSWGDAAVTLHVAPTPGALLHPIVLHHMEMVGRILPRWRIVGHAYRDDVVTDDAIEMLARSPYHEVQFLDRPRPTEPLSDRCDLAPPLEELFGRIRCKQLHLATTRPILVRLPADSLADAASAGKIPGVPASSAPAGF